MSQLSQLTPNEWRKFNEQMDAELLKCETQKKLMTPLPDLETPGLLGSLIQSVNQFLPKFTTPNLSNQGTEIRTKIPKNLTELKAAANTHYTILQAFLVARRASCVVLTAVFKSELETMFGDGLKEKNIDKYLASEDAFHDYHHSTYTRMDYWEQSEMERVVGPLFPLKFNVPVEDISKRFSFYYHACNMFTYHQKLCDRILENDRFSMALQLELYSTTIKSIQVWPLALQPGELKMLLRCLPDLEKLDLQGGSVSQDDFESHENLKTIYMHNCDTAVALKDFDKTQFPSFGNVHIIPKLDAEWMAGSPREGKIIVKGQLKYPIPYQGTPPKWEIPPIPEPDWNRSGSSPDILFAPVTF